jgi:hypothetical protein
MSSFVVAETAAPRRPENGQTSAVPPESGESGWVVGGVVGTYSGEITGGDDGSGYDDGLRTDRNHSRVFSC